MKTSRTRWSRWIAPATAVFAGTLIGLAAADGASTTDKATGEIVKPPSKTRPRVVLAVCSPDGDYFAFADDRGRVRYGRSSDGVILRTFYQCNPTALAFSGDGALLATAGGAGKGISMKVWSVGDGRMLGQLSQKSGKARSLAFSPDNEFVVCRQSDSSVSVWRWRGDENVWSITLAPTN